MFCDRRSVKEMIDRYERGWCKVRCGIVEVVVVSCDEDR